MRTVPSDRVIDHLRTLVETLEDGARIPTVRDLMKRFKVSQGTVQEAVSRLREEGFLTAQVGRGTYVTKHGGRSAAAAGARLAEPGAPSRSGLGSLLILANASMNERCILVQNRIIAEVTGDGAKVVQISYHDTEHLLGLLGSVPRFDATILQSHYETIPVRLLHLLQSKTKALVTDGHTVAGVDVDRIGTDWEEALGLALEHLTGLGHRRIGLVSLDSAAQPILSARRAFARLGNWRGTRLEVVPPLLLQGLQHPTQHAGAALERAFGEIRGSDGSLPFTALICLGISDAAGIRHALAQAGLSIPEDLSVHILGHHDVPTEHFDTFTVTGSSHREAAAELVAAIRKRLAFPALPPQTTFLSCDQVLRATTRPVSTFRQRAARRSA